MKIKDLKAKLPESLVYELKPEMRYLIVGNDNYIPRKIVGQVVDNLGILGIQSIFIMVSDVHDALKVFEMVPNPLLLASPAGPDDTESPSDT